MNAKEIEVQMVNATYAIKGLNSLKNEIVEIITDPDVDSIIQPDTTIIKEQFDAIASALLAYKNLVKRIKLSHLQEQYFAEFEVVDGLNQHPSGLTFKEWMENNDH